MYFRSRIQSVAHVTNHPRSVACARTPRTNTSATYVIYNMRFEVQVSPQPETFIFEYYQYSTEEVEFSTELSSKIFMQQHPMMLKKTEELFLHRY